MPYPNTSSTALFEAEKDGGFEVGVTPIPGTKEGKTSTFLGGDAWASPRTASTSLRLGTSSHGS